MRRFRLVLLLLFAACVAPVPKFFVAPSVTVTRFEADRIDAGVIRFEARIEIENRMRVPLQIAAIEWGADVFGRSLVDESFAVIHLLGARGSQHVTLPFQISVGDPDPADEADPAPLHVRFHGAVRPVGIDPIPFEATRTVSVPRLSSNTEIRVHRTAGG